MHEIITISKYYHIGLYKIKNKKILVKKYNERNAAMQ